MKILIRRIAKRNTYTIGKLYINNEYFCDTLEDKDRGLTESMSKEEIQKIKIKGETCIPLGTYSISITYSNRFQKKMPLINNVKGFDGIRIHSGNTDKDTEGCILVGENKVVGKVINSKVTYNKLYTILNKALSKKELITLTIK